MSQDLLRTCQLHHSHADESALTDWDIELPGQIRGVGSPGAQVQLDLILTWNLELIMNYLTSNGT